MNNRVEYKMECRVLAAWPQKDLTETIESWLGGLAGVTRYGSLTPNPVKDVRRFWKCVSNGHWGLLEHGGATCLLKCNRGVTHELVRHRLCSYLQESTRYRAYEEDGIVLRSVSFPDALKPVEEYAERVARQYRELLEKGASRDEARHILPNCLEASVVVTANWRQWLHILVTRTGKGVHPDMAATMREVETALYGVWPDLNWVLRVYSDGWGELLHE